MKYASILIFSYVAMHCLLFIVHISKSNLVDVKSRGKTGDK